MALGLIGSALAGAVGASAGGMAQSMMKEDEMNQQNLLAQERMKLQGDISLNNQKAVADYTDQREATKKKTIGDSIAQVRARILADNPKATEIEVNRAIAADRENNGDIATSSVFDGRARYIEQNEVQNRRADTAEKQQERIARAQEASAGRSAQDQKWQQLDREEKKKFNGLLGQYITAVDAKDVETANRIRREGIELTGVDMAKPAGKETNSYHGSVVNTLEGQKVMVLNTKTGNYEWVDPEAKPAAKPAEKLTPNKDRPPLGSFQK